MKTTSRDLRTVFAVGQRVRYTDTTPNPNFRGLIGTITNVTDTSATVAMEPNNQGAEGDHIFVQASGDIQAWDYIQLLDVTIREETDPTDIL